MKQHRAASTFKAKLQRPAKPGDGAAWSFVLIPAAISESLPRRGRTTVDGTLAGHPFRATLEPDGQLGHWLRVDADLLAASGARVGSTVALTVRPVDEEPEPAIPDDLREALAAAPEARTVWDDTTPLARLDWIHWIESGKQARTRAKRIRDACDKLASGHRRVCCFDPSGYFSKAFSAPEAATASD